MADRLGQQCGNYRLVSLLGQGGYAEVYLGHHVRFKQQAAIKVLHAHLSDQEAEHFQQEAETIATLAHPSIIRVLDFDVQEGVPFLVIDYATGGTLRHRYPKGSLVPLPVIVSSVKQMAAALQYAHEKKFIHRDVKPENMLIGQHQEVLLSDFGIATIAHSTSSLNVSAEGTSGTLAYMAPEQIEGHPRAASDQYALAVVVYEWLCGERPFEGSVSELMAQHLSMPPPSLRERVPAIPLEVEQVVLRALAKDPKERFASVAAFSAALEQASQRALTPTVQLGSSQPILIPAAATVYETVAVAPNQPVLPTETTPSADLPVGALEPTVYPGSSVPNGLDTPESGVAASRPQPGQLVAPTAAVVSPPLEPTMPVQQKTRRLPRTSAALLIGLAFVVLAAGVLGSLSLLAHFGVSGTRSGAITAVIRGGTWTEDAYDPDSLLPNEGSGNWIDQALYLPLFYGDAQGVVHPGAAREIPSVGNGGISADATTWTFHLRPDLVWSDGAPYDARDVDYTWKLWRNPKFGAAYPNGATGFEPIARQTSRRITSRSPSTSHTPMLRSSRTGWMASWPRCPRTISAGWRPKPSRSRLINLNPQVTSGPFMVAESLPGDHYTLVRNPRYYRAHEGLPYLDKVVFRTSAADQDATLKELQAGAITAARTLSVEASMVQAYQRLSNYTLVTPPTSGGFEALWFNFHNTVLASHPEVRQAMAMTIDHQALIQVARQGFATPLCTDHPSALHPGYEPGLSCPEFDLALANQLLSDNGWVKGADGVRFRGGQRLEFEYSTCTSCGSGRLASEAIIERNFKAIGIKLDIHNYPGDTFFRLLLAWWEGVAAHGSRAWQI